MEQKVGMFSVVVCNIDEIMVLIDVWGGKFRSELIASYVKSIDDMDQCLEYEVSSGYLVNIRRLLKDEAVPVSFDTRGKKL